MSAGEGAKEHRVRLRVRVRVRVWRIMNLSGFEPHSGLRLGFTMKI